MCIRDRIKDVVQSVDEREIGARVYDEATEIRDCRNCYVSPGLVNLHTHSPMTILRGIAAVSYTHLQYCV